MGNKAWSHSNKEWQQTYDLAKRFGWTWKENTSHGGATLLCPAGECRPIRVYSTASSTESFARSSRKKITWCPHREISDPLAEVETNLESAERFLTGAEALMQRNNAYQQMEELLELVSDKLQEAQELFDKVFRLFEDQSDIARRTLGATELVTEPEGLVSKSGSLLRRATLDLKDLPPAHSKVSELTEKLDQLKSRQQGLEDRMSNM